MKKVVATILLGLFLLKHFIMLIIAKLSKKSSDGYNKFSSNFEQDDIEPVSLEEAKNFSEMHKCIRCGICDSLCQNSTELMKNTLSPSLVASTYSRSLPEMKYGKQSIQGFIDCKDCNECFNMCPTGIDIKTIVNQVTRLG